MGIVTDETEVLIVTAVEAERAAVLEGIEHLARSEAGYGAGYVAGYGTGNGARVRVIVGGIGPVQAAVATTHALASMPYCRLVISAGIGGGFAGRAPVEALVLAESSIMAELGAETAEGFVFVEALGFGGISRMEAALPLAQRWQQALVAAGELAVIGPIVTVSTVTGTSAATERLLKRVPYAAAEAMEGFGVAAAARAYGKEWLEIRAISNAVGPRNRKTWKIPQALDKLRQAFGIWKGLG